jgi:4-amino-4-deoxy-L-arabinose transferase-like glycosyltransferase
MKVKEIPKDWTYQSFFFWFVVIVAVIRAIIAFVFGSDTGRILTPDSPTYIGPARALLEDFRFTTGPGSNTLEFVRTPGYPAFLSFLFLIGRDSVHAVVVLQAALSSLTLIPVFALAKRLFDQRIAWATVVVCALDPLTNYHSMLILTESLASAVLITLALLLVRVIQDDRRDGITWILIGLTSAALTFIRPANYYFLAVLFVFVIGLSFRRRWTKRVFTKVSILVVAPFIFIVGGWQFRNHVEVESWRFSGIEAVNMYLYRSAGVIALRDDRNWLEVQQELAETFGPRQPGEEQGTYYDRMYEEGFGLLRQEPVLTGVMTLQGFWRGAVSFPMRTEAFFDRLGIPDLAVARYAMQYIMIPVWILAFFGIGRFRRSRNRASHVLLATLLFYNLLISAGPEAYSRFRVPVLPIIFMFATAGFFKLRAYRNDTRWERESV